MKKSPFLNRRKKTTALSIGLLFCGVFSWQIATAQVVDTNIFEPGEIADAGAYGSTPASILTNFATDGLRVFLFIATAAAVIGIIMSGIKYMQAGGDSDKANQAKKSIIFLVIGIIILMSSYYIIRTTVNFSKYLTGETSTF